MTNPAVETTPDGTPAVDPDVSFLADFDREVRGLESTISDAPERSSAPTPDAVEPTPADATEAKADDQPSDPTAPTPDAEDIPSTPLTYTVNGQQKVADWILKVGEEGAVIPQQHLAKLQDLIQRDEWQNAQNRELYAKTQQYEKLSHKIGETEYHGMDAFRQLQAEKAMLDASGGRVMAALADPQFVTDLALAYQSGNQQQVQAVLAGVIQQVKFAGERAQFDTLKSITEQERQAGQQETLASVQDKEYDGIIADIGKALPALTPDDLKVMRDHFTKFRSHIFRPATPDEARQLGVKVGTTIKDPTPMNEWAVERANLRASMAQAAQAAAKENTARQAARPAPKSAAKKSPAKPATPAKPGARFEGDDGSYAAWKKRLEAGKWAHDDVAEA